MNEVAFRSRTSPYPMLEVEEAKNLILQCCLTNTVSEVIDVSKCKGRVLYEDVRSQESVPPFDASTKDGYAVRAEDGAGIRRVRDVVAAGDAVGTFLVSYELFYRHPFSLSINQWYREK